MTLKVPPSRLAGVTFKQASDLRMDDREAVFFPGEAVEIDGIGRAIDLGAQRFQNVAGGIKFPGINKDPVGPAKGGIHVGHIEFGQGAFVKDGAEAVAVLDSGKVDNGAEARIEPEAKSPVLPRNLAAFHLEACT